MSSTPRNADALARLKAHFAARDCGTEDTGDEGLGEHVASFSAQYKVRITPEGTIHVYRPRLRSTTDDRLSEGVDDPAFEETERAQTSRRLAKMNKDHAEFWARRKGMFGQ